MLERDIEQYFVKKSKEHGLLQYKFNSQSFRSVPDRLVIHKGITSFIEFKAPGKKPTLKQTAEHQKIMAAGAKVFVVDSKEAVDCLISEILG